MPDRPALTLEQQIAAAQGWWREAGVDQAFVDDPQAWLAQPSAEHPVETAAPERPAPPPPPAIGGERAGWPGELAAFHRWWLDEPSLDVGVASPRVPPRGPANAPLAILVPIALVFVIYILARPTSWGSRSLQRSYEACPTLRPGLIALLITMTIGFAINDSGVAIPANGAIIAVPLIIAVSVRVLENEARGSATTRASRRG